jgi:uncharacterized membrane protein YccF (DUF307 family)
LDAEGFRVDPVLAWTQAGLVLVVLLFGLPAAVAVLRRPAHDGP